MTAENCPLGRKKIQGNFFSSFFSFYLVRCPTSYERAQNTRLQRLLPVQGNPIKSCFFKINNNNNVKTYITPNISKHGGKNIFTPTLNRD